MLKITLVKGAYPGDFYMRPLRRTLSFLSSCWGATNGLAVVCNFKNIPILKNKGIKIVKENGVCPSHSEVKQTEMTELEQKSFIARLCKEPKLPEGFW